MKKVFDHMSYLPDMEQTEASLMDEVLSAVSAYDYAQYTAEDVRRVLAQRTIDPQGYAVLLSPAAEPFLEQMAARAMAETRARFGNTICMFTPLYIANYCENECVYCGFNCKNRIHRGKLTLTEIEQEMQAIANTGLKEILLLTGESRDMSPVDYIGEAVKIARRYFSTIGIEIYPLNTDEYHFLQECGADFVSVYQETYNPVKYETQHLSGPKRSFPYRFHAQDRALQGGMRGVSFGALLGLDDFRKDAYATGLHAYHVQRRYPHAEISFSCPRLRPIINNATVNPHDVHETQLLQVLLAYRLFLPCAGITISTRERAGFRDHVIGMVATKISAGVKVGVGGHDEEAKGDEQFEISDDRSVNEIRNMIRARGLQPVFTDYVYV